MLLARTQRPISARTDHSPSGLWPLVVADVCAAGLSGRGGWVGWIGWCKAVEGGLNALLDRVSFFEQGTAACEQGGGYGFCGADGIVIAGCTHTHTHTHKHTHTWLIFTFIRGRGSSDVQGALQCTRPTQQTTGMQRCTQAHTHTYEHIVRFIRERGSTHVESSSSGTTMKSSFIACDVRTAHQASPA